MQPAAERLKREIIVSFVRDFFTYLVRLDQNYNLVSGSERRLNVDRSFKQANPTISSLANSSIVVCFNENSTEAQRVMCQLVDEAGANQGDIIDIS